MGGSQSQSCCSSDAIEKTVDTTTTHIDNPAVSPRSEWVEANVTATQLVYVERGPDGSLDTASTVSLSTGSNGSDASRTKANGMAMLQIAGAHLKTVPRCKLDQHKLATFRDSLAASGLDISKWGANGTKTVEHLFWEVHEQHGSVIIGLSSLSQPKRVTRLVKIKISADIYGVEHILFSRMQFMHDGQIKERRQVPLKKLTWDISDSDASQFSDVFYQEGCQYTEHWRNGCAKALEERLGLSTRWQKQFLVEVSHDYKTEDNLTSDGFPGLNTLYCIHEVKFCVTSSEHPGVQCIGLPMGQEFATAEGDFNFDSNAEEVAIGTQLNIWTWAREAQNAPASPPTVAPTVAKPETAPVAKDQGQDHYQRSIKRVPLPAALAYVLAGRKANATQVFKPPNTELWEAMDGQKTDWGKAKHIARRILDADYSLAHFFEDLSAFPELNLYLLEDKVAASDGAVGKIKTMSSGRTIGDEYQRTMGAFFAVYWLMRIDIDGKAGFSYGVDDDWAPLAPGQGPDNDQRMHPVDKRTKFVEDGKWDYFKKLLSDARLIAPPSADKKKQGWGLLKTKLDTVKEKVDEKRLVALLALTAFHDIMKMPAVLPKLQPEHAPYHGYQAGDTIGDHDVALGYVMEMFPKMLPSFRDLDAAEQRSVQFTQCNLCFNHGWFVQAEAPPGAIFTKFREALIRDHKSEIGKADIALYFVHWLTDLAGAEPTPLGGCEKFSIKFPLPVLNSFLRSFEFVENVATQSETEVMEEYLQVRWKENTPPAGPLPDGDSAICKMRLLCMAQMNAAPILHDFGKLDAEDMNVLCEEMARTGCYGQSFSSHLIPKDVQASDGPAFLVYYGPAFLQNLGSDTGAKRLSALAEIYRAARELWPIATNAVVSNVTIRIDMIKSLSLEDMLKSGSDVWLMVKHNTSEAFIERSSKKKLNKMITTTQGIQVLDFACVQKY